MVVLDQGIGAQLEKSGWLQGGVLSSVDFDALCSELDILYSSDNYFGVIATQSCDLANNNLDLDPYIEIGVARKIGRVDGNYTCNKNTRKLHVEMHSIAPLSGGIYAEVAVEFLAYCKYPIRKDFFVGRTPTLEVVLNNQRLFSYVSWLSARYSKPAFPTMFNNMLTAVDAKDKRKKLAKKLHPSLTGIYLEITPNRDLVDSEFYEINLMGLMKSVDGDKIKKIQESFDDFSGILESAGMVVNKQLVSDDKVSVAVFERFNRFYYDEISFKANEAYPQEINGL